MLRVFIYIRHRQSNKKKRKKQASRQHAGKKASKQAGGRVDAQARVRVKPSNGGK